MKRKNYVSRILAFALVCVLSLGSVQCLTAVGADNLATAATSVTSHEDGVTYCEFTFDTATRMNQVKLPAKDWGEVWPQDVAIDVKCTNGVWLRVAELHDIQQAESAEGLTFSFAQIDNVSRVRIGGRNVCGRQMNFGDAEMYLEATLAEADYTGTVKEVQDRFNIPELVSDNLVAGKMAEHSPYGFGDLQKLTNGTIGYSGDFAYVTEGEVTDGVQSPNFFQYTFAEETPLNLVRLYASNKETAMRPRDIALDVLLADGSWQRVIACYNMNFDGEWKITSVSGVVQHVALDLRFETITCKGFRVSANHQRARENTTLYSGQSFNWKLVEIQAFYDPSITSYTGIETPDAAKYVIPMTNPSQLAKGAAVTTTGFLHTDASNTTTLTAITDGNKQGAIPIIYFGTNTVDNDLQIVEFEVELSNAPTINRIDLTLFLELFESDSTGAKALRRDVRDLAVDVCDPYGRWVRVAEEHNIDYEAYYGTEQITESKYHTRNYYFKPMQGTKIRISFNKAHVREQEITSTAKPTVSPTEIAAYMDYSVMPSQYSVLDTAPATTGEGMIPTRYEEPNFATGATVTTSGVSDAEYPLTNLVDGDATTSAYSYYWQGEATTEGKGSALCHYDISFAGERIINEVTLYYDADALKHRERDVAVDVITKDGFYVRVAELHGSGEPKSGEPDKLVLGFEETAAVGVRITANCVQSSSYLNSNETACALVYSEVEVRYNQLAEVTGIASTENTQRIIPTTSISRDYSAGAEERTFQSGTMFYREEIFDSPHRINEVRIYVQGANLDSGVFPHDLALSACVDGRWRRVAEINNIGKDFIIGSYFSFTFRAAEVSGIRITGPHASTMMENFEKTDIRAGYNPTVANYSRYLDLTGDLLHTQEDARELRRVLVGTSRGCIDVTYNEVEDIRDLIRLKKNIS